MIGDVQENMEKAMRSDAEDNFKKNAGLQKVCLFSEGPFHDMSPVDSAWCL